MIQLTDYTITLEATAREALKQLERLSEADTRTLFVLDDNKLVGTLTDGDIRRGLLGDKEISQRISDFMNRDFKSIRREELNPETLSRFREREIWVLPVLTGRGEIENVINLHQLRTVIPAAALIMAGGRGERLRPLTDLVPKPLLKVGNKTILDINFDRLISFGIRKFYVSVKYLGSKIIEHLGDGSSRNVSIMYLEEDEPLGTLGACSLVEDMEEQNLIVMNADLLTNIDFEDFYNSYQANGALMCVASIPYTVKIPYGVMKMDEEDCIRGLVEKPTYTYYANAGIYLLHRKLISRIPKNTYYNATDLMHQMIDDCQRLAHYPILQYWLDIGKYEDYVKAQDDFKRIHF